MSHFAEIDANGIVLRVLVVEQNVIDSGALGDIKNWIQTSYNTHGGIHIMGGTPLRKNYAGIGYNYDSVRDAFIPPKRYNSWVFNEDTADYEPPVPFPEDGKIYNWDETTISWKEGTF